MRPTIALPIDVLRRFDPTVTEEALETPIDGISPIGRSEGDAEIITSRIEGIESRLERQTGRPYRRRSQGSVDDRKTMVAPSRVTTEKNQMGYQTRIVLPDDQITEIKRVEIRESFDEFRRVEDDDLSVNHQDGTIELRRSIVPTWLWEWINHDGYNLRLAYEYGALGGSHQRAGQTTVTESVSSTTSSIGLEDPARLPPDGVMLLGDEYISGSITDRLEIEERGLRGTTPSSHDPGTTIHYCPMHVREGVAAAAAIELVTVADRIGENVGDQFDPQQKVDRWSSQWDRVISTSGTFISL